MGVIPGHGGQAFIPDTLDKIKKLKTECKRLRISPYLSVDGDVKFTTTAPQCIEAGANLLVVGSAVFGAEDKAAAVKAFKVL